MKFIILGIGLATGLVACNGNSAHNNHDMGDHNMMNGSMDSMPHNMGSETSSHAMGKGDNKQINNVVTAYLGVKNALAADNASQAATAGKAVADAVQKVDEASLTDAEKKIFSEVKDDMKEHGEHIAENAGKIAHQREHFETLSKDVYDLVKVFGSSETMYYTHCPMYNNNKGANWISEVKEIKNPYLGKEMPTCGMVKEEIK